MKVISFRLTLGPRRSDLWSFNGTYWVWRGGQGAPGLYPQARRWHNCWMDRQDRFWVFGGDQGRYLGDLWMYDGNFSFVAGTQSTDVGGVYGTLGVGSSSNFPGGRQEAGSCTDNNGDFWLFGGVGYDNDTNLG